MVKYSSFCNEKDGKHKRKIFLSLIFFKDLLNVDTTLVIRKTFFFHSEDNTFWPISANYLRLSFENLLHKKRIHNTRIHWDNLFSLRRWISNNAILCSHIKLYVRNTRIPQKLSNFQCRTKYDTGYPTHRHGALKNRPHILRLSNLMYLYLGWIFLVHIGTERIHFVILSHVTMAINEGYRC